MKKTLLAITLAALTSGGAATSALAQPKAPEPDYTISGNVAVVSDYRYRGISQTDKKPAIQGGFDFAHKSGFYLGNWNSNVSSFGTAPGGNVEMDFYGGYKFEAAGLSFDVGTIYYYYPGSVPFVNTAPKTPEISTHEIYVGMGYGPISLKVSNTLSKGYFGIGQNTSLSGRTYGSAKGTLYYDLTVSHEIASKTVLSAHVGYLDLDGDTSAAPFKLTDYKVGVSHDAGFATIGLAYVGNDINATAKLNFEATPTGRGTIKNYTDTVVLSLTKTF
jgi:uncharacterized protein (TIGR02001 family)